MTSAMLVMVLGVLTAHAWGLQTTQLEASRQSPVGSSACSLRLGKTTVRGALDKQIVRRVSAAHRHELCLCALGAQGSRSESVVIGYAIGTSGQVQRAEVRSSTTSAVMADCMANAVEGWSFPNGRICGYVMVEQTIHLFDEASLPPGPRSMAKHARVR